MKKNIIQVDNYGDMLAQINQLELIYYKEVGDYSGEYLAILADDERMFIYKGSFGSCSGCDWLEDNQIGFNDSPYKIKYKDAVGFADNKPLYIVPYKDNKFWLKQVLRLINVEINDV